MGNKQPKPSEENPHPISYDWLSNRVYQLQADLDDQSQDSASLLKGYVEEASNIMTENTVLKEENQELKSETMAKTFEIEKLNEFIDRIYQEMGSTRPTELPENSKPKKDQTFQNRTNSDNPSQRKRKLAPASSSEPIRKIMKVEEEKELQFPQKKISDQQIWTKETLIEGTGEYPIAGSNLSIHYTGTLEDGSVFDSSIDRGEVFRFVIGKGACIKGWEEALLTM